MTVATDTLFTGLSGLVLFILVVWVVVSLLRR
jgi:hypothetical protein